MNLRWNNTILDNINIMLRMLRVVATQQGISTLSDLLTQFRISKLPTIQIHSDKENIEYHNMTISILQVTCMQSKTHIIQFLPIKIDLFTDKYCSS